LIARKIVPQADDSPAIISRIRLGLDR